MEEIKERGEELQEIFHAEGMLPSAPVSLDDRPSPSQSFLLPGRMNAIGGLAFCGRCTQSITGSERQNRVTKWAKAIILRNGNIFTNHVLRHHTLSLQGVPEGELRHPAGCHQKER